MVVRCALVVFVLGCASSGLPAEDREDQVRVRRELLAVPVVEAVGRALEVKYPDSCVEPSKRVRVFVEVPRASRDPRFARVEFGCAMGAFRLELGEEAGAWRFLSFEARFGQNFDLRRVRAAGSPEDADSHVVGDPVVRALVKTVVPSDARGRTSVNRGFGRLNPASLCPEGTRALLGVLFDHRRSLLVWGEDCGSGVFLVSEATAVASIE